LAGGGGWNRMVGYGASNSDSIKSPSEITIKEDSLPLSYLEVTLHFLCSSANCRFIVLPPQAFRSARTALAAVPTGFVSSRYEADKSGVIEADKVCKSEGAALPLIDMTTQSTRRMNLTIDFSAYSWLDGDFSKVEQRDGLKIAACLSATASRGLLIMSLPPDNPLYALGVREADKIVSELWTAEPVEELSQLLTLIQRLERGERLELLVTRKDSLISIPPRSIFDD